MYDLSFVAVWEDWSSLRMGKVVPACIATITRVLLHTYPAIGFDFLPNDIFLSVLNCF